MLVLKRAPNARRGIVISRQGTAPRHDPAAVSAGLAYQKSISGAAHLSFYGPRQCVCTTLLQPGKKKIRGRERGWGKAAQSRRNSPYCPSSIHIMAYMKKTSIGRQRRDAATHPNRTEEKANKITRKRKGQATSTKKKGVDRPLPLGLFDLQEVCMGRSVVDQMKAVDLLRDLSPRRVAFALPNMLV